MKQVLAVLLRVPGTAEDTEAQDADVLRSLGELATALLADYDRRYASPLHTTSFDRNSHKHEVLSVLLRSRGLEQAELMQVRDTTGGVCTSARDMVYRYCVPKKAQCSCKHVA